MKLFIVLTACALSASGQQPKAILRTAENPAKSGKAAKAATHISLFSYLDLVTEEYKESLADLKRFDEKMETEKGNADFLRERSVLIAITGAKRENLRNQIKAMEHIIPEAVGRNAITKTQAEAVIARIDSIKKTFFPEQPTDRNVTISQAEGSRGAQ